MTPVRSILTGLPGVAFATLAITGETIAICRGEPSYYRVETTKTAEELKTMYSVSSDQARAMLAGTKPGWHTLLADPQPGAARAALGVECVVCGPGTIPYRRKPDTQAGRRGSPRLNKPARFDR